MNLFDLKDKVAIVTGASRGIGEAIAVRLAEHGAAVVLVARKPDALHAVVARITANGGRALGLPAHTGKMEDVKAVVAKTIEHFGKVDVLVNNAAANPYFGPMLQIEDPAWDKTFEVNVKGYFAMMREVANHLVARNAPGSLINVASIAGLRSAPFQGVYGMTKAAVISMTQTLAQELGGSNIRVNAIAPGLVDTKFASAIVGDEDMRKHVVERTALNRHAQPDEIAGAAVFLASQASSYVTGQVLVVDGGTITTT
ncbi:MAG: glucose 1-dehydrogenase [Archangium sp.]|nr:glucose 1-dehydrogenase [Archangium sp.]MDP3151198.1 glucose 1-dehydrogenase [Archangium sp.]MDP3570161.1 glucose 1-dehydrogenase [Archangium sp.]